MTWVYRLFLILTLIFIPTLGFCVLNFDGGDDYIGFGDVDVVDVGTGDITMTAWINTNNFDDYQTILAKETFTDDLQWRINQTTGVQIIYIAGSASLGGTGLAVNTWYSVTAVRKSGNVQLYLNGIPDGALDSNAGSISNTKPLSIGSRISGTAQFFDGLIDEVAIWNTALTQTDITLLYASKVKGMPYQIQPANLVAYWPLDDLPEGGDLAGATFVDRSSNTNNGTGSDADTSGGQGKAEEVLSYPD